MLGLYPGIANMGIVFDEGKNTWCNISTRVWRKPNPSGVTIKLPSNSSDGAIGEFIVLSRLDRGTWW